MNPPPNDLPVWSADRMPELVGALAAQAGLGVAQETWAPIRKFNPGAPVFAYAEALGIEANRQPILGAPTHARLRELAPALIEIPGVGWLGVLDVGRRRARVLTPDYRGAAVPIVRIVDRLLDPQAAEFLRDLDGLLGRTAVRPRNAARRRRALLRAWSADAPVATAWALRRPAGQRFGQQLRDAGLVRRLGTVLSAYAVEYGVNIAAWWVLGWAVLSGKLDAGWLGAWMLLLGTAVPFRWIGLRARGAFAVGLGGVLKQRLFTGAVQMDPDAVRRDGAGALFGRVVESEAVETLALNGGMSAALAAVELLLAGVVLAFGADGPALAALLTCWTAYTASVGLRYARRRSQWTEQRLTLTHQLVEAMTGNRTRVAQQPPEQWHEAEDVALAAYAERSRALDRDAVRLTAAVPRGWPLMALAALAPAFLTGTAGVSALAVSAGGILLAQRALKRLTAGMTQLAGAWIGWRRIAPVFEAATRRPPAGSVLPERRGGSAPSVLDAQAVAYQYAGRPAPTLRDLDFRIRRGERILIEGESGGGKSTLVGLLAGWRSPTAGAILAGGYDLRVLGDHAWRSRVVAAPQYHENHLVSASLAFNLLMGRRWPAAPEDLAEARTVCRGLGLGPLLDRMPGGLEQVVGESGWQLSQGERGRVFLARALLQRSDVVILDESFAALDPHSLDRAITFAASYAPTLVVVAHP